MNHSNSVPSKWLLIVLLLLVAGCGGSDETTSTEGDAKPAVPALPTADNLPKMGEPQGDPESELFPRVEFQTSAGNFTVKLHRDRVPGTVDNFLGYVDQGFYDETVFHELTPGYAVVGGNFILNEGSLVLKDGLKSIRNEAANGLPNQRGTIAMAREPQDADSARCQFFINLGDNSSLDYAPDEPGVPLWETAGYCAFGTVEGDGLTVLDEIARKPVTSRNGMDRVPVEPIVILKAERL